VTTHLRARTAQAGAFLALVLGVLTGVQTPALADNPTVNIDRVSPTTVASGSNVTMRFTVSDPGPGEGGGEPQLDITVSGMSCGCDSRERIDGTRTFDVTLTAPNVAAGQKRDVVITVSAKRANGDSAQDTDRVTVEGPAAPTTVRLVSGRIKDDSGARVSGVQVVMKDSAGHQYQTTTNGDGGYSFTSSDSQPIAAGNIQIAAAKEGFEPANVSVQGTAGRTVTVPLTLKKTAVATSPTPSASASTSAAPTEPVDEEETTDDESQGVNLGADTDEAAGTTDDEGTNWLLIAMGGLLVAAGIGAMVLVMMRRKRADELSSDTGLGTAVPASAGGFDATRVAAPVGAGRGGDATMIAPAAGMGAGLGGGLADAPTMIHRQPVEDEFPDPYGAPLPAGGGYAGSGSQWDDPQQGGGDYGAGNYGAAQPYGQQQGGGNYGAQGGPRYDEHTSMYQPEQPQQPQRYDEHTGMYQPEQGDNYGGGYDQGGYPQQQGGYDQGWNGQDAGGYGPQAGYDQGGYQQPGGNYGGGYDQAGYDQQQAGYPQPGGYGGGYDQPQQGGHPQQGHPQQGAHPQQGGGNYGNNPQRPNRDWMDE
jgi:hypothetical protein